eukprot:10923520-Lingulodinium_polyedra.AAC.1
MRAPPCGSRCAARSRSVSRLQEYPWGLPRGMHAREQEALRAGNSTFGAFLEFVAVLLRSIAI